MLRSLFIEDIFLDFYLLVSTATVQVQWHDSTPIESFATTLMSGNELTKAQSMYVLRLLTKYKSKAIDAGLDYTPYITNPVWKKTFRVIDMSKRIHVEESPAGYTQVCVKFPYDLKKTFDLEFTDLLSKSSTKMWDADRKLRIIPLNDINVVALHNFVIKHGFEIDATFEEVLSDVEEVWNQQDKIIPYSEVIDNEVVIHNAIEDAKTYWEQTKTNSLGHDLLTAKSMGFPVRLNHVPVTPLEKIAASLESMFWIKDNKTFFDLYKELKTGCVCFVLDRTSNIHDWVRDFVLESSNEGIVRSDIKVCFRESDMSKNSRFNEWVKEQGLGGTVDTGRIFLFENKPPKWLFTKNTDVKIIVTNNLYPNTNTLTQQWIEHHPCVLHIGDIKPSQKRNLKIVGL